MANDEKGATGSGKPSPIKLLRRPLLEQGMARTLNAIEGVVDPELESGRQLLLGTIENEQVGDPKLGNNKVESDSITGVKGDAESPRQPKSGKHTDPKKKGASSPSKGTPTDEFIYNLKVTLTSDQLESLESFCVKIRGEIMRKQKRRQQIGLQTIAQTLFIRLLADEKFRKEFQADIVQNYQ